MTVSKGTLDAMWDAMAYLEEYGPETPCEFSEHEKDGEAYKAFVAIKTAYKKEKRRVDKAKFMARRRKMVKK